MADDADIITVMGGTNDVRLGVPLGKMEDRTPNTFYGALHTLMQGLYTKYIAPQEQPAPFSESTAEMAGKGQLA